MAMVRVRPGLGECSIIVLLIVRNNCGIRNLLSMQPLLQRYPCLIRKVKHWLVGFRRHQSVARKLNKREIIIFGNCAREFTYQPIKGRHQLL